MSAPENCGWCRPRIPRKASSDWEQQDLSGEWKRMCGRCARVRLGNPYNALIPMRKVGTHEPNTKTAEATP